ncbi:MAG: DegT/DnrJ/EryC1/StrS family aminotransferase [Magnetococcales bacterium]|nr:DegT/DnrJ/EryC1/StrS family aminotransferase [Magnetococcales bacterium]MBF0150220.1 DegT/DnrJ/EryC1/StrS family aminotransferase [Magnetococcales bacterium]MBF0630005.1 DegT/DnrJ/EryC1/StrS family aminotransferase [Magnetococcales bacterium]
MRFIDLQTQYETYKEEMDRAIAEVLASCQFINGPQVAKLESTLAHYVGVREAVGFSSGTDSLLAVLMAWSIGPGDEVITSPFTFFSTAEVIALLGAKPVFVDVRDDTLNMDPHQVEAAITPRTRAIMPVSIFGQCADMTSIHAIAKKHDLSCLEDGCQSFGGTHHGRRSCGLSHAGATSFFPAKALGGYGDGGMVFTDDADLALQLKSIREHGQKVRYHHMRLGMNGRLDTLQAAVLLVKFAHFEDEIKQRQRIARYYLDHLPAGVRGPVVLAENQSVYSQFTIRIARRDQVQAALQQEGIPTAIHYPVPLHHQPAFANIIDKSTLPIATRAAQEVLSLPMHPFLTVEQQDRILDALARAVAQHG